MTLIRNQTSTNYGSL